MNGQLKAKPEMENCSHLTSGLERRQQVTVTISDIFRRRNQVAITLQTVRRINDDFRTRPDKMADRDDVRQYRRLSTMAKQNGRRLSTTTLQLL